MKKSTIYDIKAGLMFALPGLLVFFLVVIIPFVYGFYLTFTDWNGVYFPDQPAPDRHDGADHGL